MAAMHGATGNLGAMAPSREVVRHPLEHGMEMDDNNHNHEGLRLTIRLSLNGILLRCWYLNITSLEIC
jgi:hypothetical protein